MENISGLTREDARKIVIEKVEHESKRDAQVIINKSEQEAQLLADKVAKDIFSIYYAAYCYGGEF